jgi:uncharacterized protein YcsI (UPF0317 family)
MEEDFPLHWACSVALQMVLESTQYSGELHSSHAQNVMQDMAIKNLLLER